MRKSRQKDNREISYAVRRRAALLGMFLLPAALFAGCGTGGQDGEAGGADSQTGEFTEEPAEISEDSQGDESTSDAYSDPDLNKTDEENLKATGFEYDRESLTYELVWSDEFDYEGEPDPEKWGYDLGGSGWGNHELQYYNFLQERHTLQMSYRLSDKQHLLHQKCLYCRILPRSHF